MTLRDLLGALRRHWAVATAAFLAFAIVGAAASFLPAPTYRATATMFVQPQPGNSSDSFGAVEAARFVLPALAEVVRTETFRVAVRDRVGSRTRGKEPTLSAKPEAGTPVLRLSAEGTDRDAVEVWANAAADRLIVTNPSSLVGIVVIDPARRPLEPSGPLKVPILAGTFVLGVIAAVFAALAMGVARRRLTGSRGFFERYGVEVIGEIPRSRHFPGRASEMLVGDTDPPLMEAYQHLTANFEILRLTKQPRSVAVTSYTVGEGKTSVTANLAWSVARLGQNTIAVDGDIRNPSLHEALGQAQGKGVTDVEPGIDALSFQQQTGLAKLTFLPSGETERHPTEVISSTLPRLLGMFEAPDRLVMVDCPPLLVAEATLIAVMTGAAILVVDISKRDPDHVDKALRELRQAGVDVIGVVLNRSRRRIHRHASEYYYHYQRDQGSRSSRRGRQSSPEPQPTQPQD